jgi:hypothetical protein
MSGIDSAILDKLEWEAFLPQRRYLRDHGEVFVGTRRPKGVRRRAAKECYMNAAVFVDEHPEYEYCEGLAVASRDHWLPCDHAWVALRGADEAIELTWRDPGIAYFGIRVSSGDLIQSQVESGVYDQMCRWLAERNDDYF